MVRGTAFAVVTVLCATAQLSAAGHPDDQSIAPAIKQTVGINADTLPMVSAPRPASPARRPAALPVLYTSLAALQIYDGFSTMTGQTRGLREVNPAMQWMAADPIRLWSVKAATTTVFILAGERMWKRHRVAAVATMAAINGVTVFVAAHNTSVLKQVR